MFFGIMIVLSGTAFCGSFVVVTGRVTISTKQRRRFGDRNGAWTLGDGRGPSSITVTC